MAIKPIGNRTIPVLSTEKRLETTKGTLSFEQILQEAARNKAEGARPGGEGISKMEAPTVSTTPFPPTSFLSLDARDLSAIKQKGLDAAEQALDLLEKYERALTDPDQPAKSLGALMESLSHEVERLTKLAKELSPSDPLRRLVTEVGVLSAVSVWKHKQRPFL